ncbi:class I SAM-dependent methyltransferase [Synechocystis sp. LKSZ1]|uniref:class I SAM-dependent methyltransferase n=1 Tax=Synechocystis sp. LKSZ1 TaxID=3144951 RepID=UPI00336BB859
MSSPAPDLQAISQFFQAWDSYQQILRYNYMEHRQIAQVLQTYLQDNCWEPFTCFDLGCGDGSFSAQVFTGLPVVSYTGVDLSQPALALAQQTFQGRFPTFQLIQADVLSFIGQQREPVDVMLSAFCLHHLSQEQKQLFLKEARSCLRPGGYFLWADVVRQAGESREQYLQHYGQMMEQDWPLATAETKTLILEHIRSSDYPETSLDLQSWAAAAGFTQLERLYQGVQGTEEVWVLY